MVIWGGHGHGQLKVHARLSNLKKDKIIRKL